MEKPLKIRLHVLSPIHIGCDDVYEPTSFVIDESKKKLISFDPIEFIKTFSDEQKKEFSKICMGDNLLSLYQFAKRAYKPSLKGREIDIAAGLVEHYNKVIRMSSYDKNAVINQFTIHRTSYNTQNNIVYIPGSSLKGSIKTAYLNVVAKVRNINAWQDKAIELERNLLQGSFESDPFRMVKISDLVTTGKAKTKIVYAINKKKKKSDRASLAERGPQQIFEVIEDGVFDGILNIEAPIQQSNIRFPIIKENLKKAINTFYIPLMESEIKMLKELEISAPLINKINNNFSGKINKSAFIIRIGRHSGAEAMTIEGHRNIKIMQGKDKKPKFDDHSTTIWLASEEAKPKNNNGLLPFGWAVMETVT